MHSLGALPFFVFDFARTLNTQTHCLAGVAREIVRRAARSAVVTNFAGHPRVGLACLAKCAYTSLQLSSPLVSAVSLASSVVSQHGHPARNSRLSRCSCSSQTRQSFSWLPQPVLRHCVQPSSVVTVLRRLLLCLINHHLVD